MKIKRNVGDDRIFWRGWKMIKNLFHKRGLKCTPQRLAVLGILEGSARHFSIAEIYDRVKSVLPGIGLATIYRALETLIELDLVKKVHLRDGCHSYATASTGHQHQVVCVDCNRVAEFKECPFEEITGELSRKTGFKIENHFIQLFGKCRECQTSVVVDR